MKEVWKEIKNFEGVYQISNLGRVKSLRRTSSQNGWDMCVLKEKILKPQKTGRCRRYLQVSLGGRLVPVHRLVARGFLGDPLHKQEVNHKDGNPSNNLVGNLEWVSHRENILHARDTGLTKTKLNPRKARAIRIWLRLRFMQTKIAKAYRVSPQTINDIKKKGAWLVPPRIQNTCNVGRVS